MLVPVIIGALICSGRAMAAGSAEPPRFAPEVRTYVENFKSAGSSVGNRFPRLSPQESMRQFSLADNELHLQDDMFL
jgi:hypothetical protein